MGDLLTYDEYQGAMDTILSDCGIHDFRMIRADLRLDSYDPEHYKAFAKLNRYLISSIANVRNVHNTYKSVDLFSEEQLSIAIKTRDFQIENYDKIAESNGTDMAAARLEERTISRDGKIDIEKSFTVDWFNLWDEATTRQSLKAIERRYNDAMEKEYFRDKNAWPVKFCTLREFLSRNQERIFTRRQMIDLVSRIGESKDPEEYVKKYKKRYGIEFFSYTDVQYAVNEIKRATLAFFPQAEVHQDCQQT